MKDRKLTETDKRNIFFIVGAFSMFVFLVFTDFYLIEALKEQKLIGTLFWAFLPLLLSWLTLVFLNRITRNNKEVKNKWKKQDGKL